MLSCGIFPLSKMANPNPKTEQLALGRGKRPKLNHQSVSMRMSAEVKQSIEAIAESYDCFYGGKPQISKLLERIAHGDLLVVPAPPTSHSKTAMKKYLSKKYRKKKPDSHSDVTTKT